MIYVLVQPTYLDNPGVRRLVSMTAPPEVPVDLRYAYLPEGFTEVEATDAKLLDFMGRPPSLVETRRCGPRGHWTLYWGFDGRSGWAVASTWSDSPVPRAKRFARWDTGCQHPGLSWTEQSSTYRVARCPDCGYVASHDSGD